MVIRPIDASTAGPPPVCSRHLVLAPAFYLRHCFAFQRMALLAAHLLFADRADLLVSRSTALSKQAALVALAADSLLDPCRPFEHDLVGAAHFFIPSPLH